MRYASLMAVYKTATGATLCLLQGFLSLLTTTGEQLLNEFDCPLLELTKTLFTVPGGNIRKAVNIVHECTNTCMLAEKAAGQTVEREHLGCNQLTFVHVIMCFVLKSNHLKILSLLIKYDVTKFNIFSGGKR